MGCQLPALAAPLFPALSTPSAARGCGRRPTCSPAAGPREGVSAAARAPPPHRHGWQQGLAMSTACPLTQPGATWGFVRPRQTWARGSTRRLAPLGGRISLGGCGSGEGGAPSQFGEWCVDDSSMSTILRCVDESLGSAGDPLCQQVERAYRALGPPEAGVNSLSGHEAGPSRRRLLFRGSFGGDPPPFRRNFGPFFAYGWSSHTTHILMCSLCVGTNLPKGSGNCFIPAYIGWETWQESLGKGTFHRTGPN
jgi:hypothetical protein